MKLFFAVMFVLGFLVIRFDPLAKATPSTVIEDLISAFVATVFIAGFVGLCREEK
jgi:hypothetical protein